MKYLLHGPIEELRSGGGDDILFIPGGGRTDKGSHSIARSRRQASGWWEHLCPGPGHSQQF